MNAPLRRLPRRLSAGLNTALVSVLASARVSARVSVQGYALVCALATVLAATLIAGCAGRAAPPAVFDPPAPYQAHYLARDGYRLPLRLWAPPGSPRAVVLAVHGFNDHAGSLGTLAEPLRRSGIMVYAHDQRGFGTTAQRGRWPGLAPLRGDVVELARWLRRRHPQAPLYLVGNSMGAAVVILALTGESPPAVDGSVLISPAVWGHELMPWYQRLGLWLGRRLAPDARIPARASQRLGIRPTDDPEILRQLARDPLILRSARFEALHGIAALMSAALEAAPRLRGPTLMLYGDEDQIIPPRALCALLARLPVPGPPVATNGVQKSAPPAWRLARYPSGYHMLTRYRRRHLSHADIAAWLLAPQAPLPSRHEWHPGQSTADPLCPNRRPNRQSASDKGR